MNEVHETVTFSKIYSAADGTEKEQIDSVRDQLKANLLVGKPLRFDWFREKKFGNKRLFYIINEESKKAILLTFATKKEQQAIIDRVVVDKLFYLNLLK